MTRDVQANLAAIGRALRYAVAEKGARIIFQAVNSGEAKGAELETNRHFHEANLEMRGGGEVWIATVDAVSTRPGFSNQAPSGVMDPEGHWAVRVVSDKEEFFAYTIRLDGKEQAREANRPEKAWKVGHKPSGRSGLWWALLDSNQ